MSRRRKRPLPADPVAARVESLSHDGRGVAHVDGKTVFIHGALPGEHVTFLYRRCRGRFDEGVVASVEEASSDRVQPRCPGFGSCGGCSLQHMAPAAQRRLKQDTLLENLRHFGGIELAPEQLLEPLIGPGWGYRRKARLGVRQVAKKGRVLVGFREKGSSFIADVPRCDVLHPSVGERFGALAELVGALSIRDRIPQIEVAAGDHATVLVFRVLAAPTAEDRARLAAFADAHSVAVHLQPEGLDSVAPLRPADDVALGYGLPEFGLELAFGPTDFTQVNADINRAMVYRALELLEPGGEDRVLDLFCGLGNFTLPLARKAGMVVGVEGDAALVARARDNARRNRIDNVEFHATDLAADLAAAPWAAGGFSQVLLDPPRTGALEVVRRLPGLGARRVLYVSCNPATLARDAGELVRAGFRLRRAGIMDMFPHTTHVESIALFEAG